MAVKEGFEPSIRRTYGSLAGPQLATPKSPPIIGCNITTVDKHNNEHNNSKADKQISRPRALGKCPQIILGHGDSVISVIV